MRLKPEALKRLPQPSVVGTPFVVVINGERIYPGAFYTGASSIFYLANISIPLLGTNIVQTPKVSGVRSLIHFLLFSICLYFGFIRKPKPDIR